MFIQFALSLRSPSDNKVFFIERTTPDGRVELVFNDYCYTRLMNPALSERRARAMLDLMGQAGRKLDETNDLGWAVRNYTKAQGSNTLTPRLHIVRVAAAQTSTGTTDIQKQLVEFTAQAVELGVDMASMPPVTSGLEVQLGWLKAMVARATTQQAQQEVVASNAPPTDGNADDLPF